MQVYQGSNCGIFECGTDVFEEPATSNLKRTFFFAAYKTYKNKYSLLEKLRSRAEIISPGRILKVCLRVGMKYYLKRIFLRNEKGCLKCLHNFLEVVILLHIQCYVIFFYFFILELYYYTHNFRQIVHVDIGWLYINN
jgi:hypothetical protein